MLKRHLKGTGLFFLGMIFLFLAACGNTGTSQGGQAPDTTLGYKQWSKAPQMKIAQEKSYFAKVNTNKGSFTIELFAKEAPLAVNNFVFLSRDGFYNGVGFHRIVSEFMIQGGDPSGTGMGGPGYKFNDEKNSLKYELGTVAMANSGKNTNGSQFFICTSKDCGGLNQQPNYTKFGKVVEGMDVVLLIDKTPVAFNGREMSTPKEKIVIESIEIVEQ